MNIALVGYGKMGKAIEEIAIARGHSIPIKIDEHNQHDLNAANFSKVDVAIEFTGPHSAFNNLKTLISFSTPVVSGSTGWTDELEAINQYCREENGSFLYASNFSVGVNIFFEINKRLASLMAPHKEYNIAIEEIHHTQKRDAPSGTAISIASQIIDAIPRKTNWVNQESMSDTELVITSKRIDPAPGTHVVEYSSEVDDITITHTAHNRKGFATGAVLAAEYIHNKKGIFSMTDVLGL